LSIGIFIFYQLFSKGGTVFDKFYNQLTTIDYNGINIIRGGDNHGREVLEGEPSENGGGAKKAGATHGSNSPCAGAKNKLAQRVGEGQLYT
jgi:hypothetical protein